MKRIADTSHSSFTVSAQTPTPTKKSAFEEDISMQFYIAQDYTVTVEGVIELTNTSGKDMSLTEYSMNLPYFTLKDTKIGYIYPKAFLVDMYSQNNSILFTFKSQYTRPVVIGKNGKITFTFSAQVERPYRDLGGLRTLSFPFTLRDNGRSLRITVTVDEKTTLIYAPNVALTLKKKNIFTVSDETGKLFLFATSNKPFSLTLTHATEISLPDFRENNSCSVYLPVSCSGCGKIITQKATGETVAQRDKNSEKVIMQFTKSITPNCAQARYERYNIGKALNSTFRAGYIISPALNQLIPASWRVAKVGSDEYIKDLTAQGVPYVYADALEYLTVPLHACVKDEECLRYAGALKTVDTSLSSVAEVESPGVTSTIKNLMTATITQQGRKFNLQLTNTSDKFLELSDISLESNSYFTLSDISNHLLPPKGTLALQLDTKLKIQTSNHDTELSVIANNESLKLTFKPITITILAVIEVLAYLFVVSLGITTVSVVGIILYNRRYGKTK